MSRMIHFPARAGIAFLIAALVLSSAVIVSAQGPGSELEQAMNGDFDGTEVNVFGVWVEGEAASFETALAVFEEQTGIDVVFEGSSDMATLITVRVEGGNAPDLAVFPQPGLMASFVADGSLVGLSDIINQETLQENYIQSWIDLGTVDEQLYGIFYRASTKSLVWYPVPEFEEAGYEIPQTWDELIALSDQIVADGSTPWCISIEHGGGSGQVGLGHHFGRIGLGG